MCGPPGDCPADTAAGVPGAASPGMLKPDDTCAACRFGEMLGMACGDDALEPPTNPPRGWANIPTLPDGTYEPLADPVPGVVAAIRATMCANVLRI